MWSFFKRGNIALYAMGIITALHVSSAHAEEDNASSDHFITQINMSLESVEANINSTETSEIIKPVQKVSISQEEAPLEEELIEETTVAYDDLPDFKEGDIHVIGREINYTAGEEDTLLDIARSFKLGYVEIRAANPHIDPWTPLPGQKITIPTTHLLPRAKQEGIVVNLGDMRLYKFETGQNPISFPIGIGREGLNTPVGETAIIRKKDAPSWYPTERMREEKPELPKMVKPGPQNPLGTHALYLGWPTFLIHGTNKPWGIGRRVSSGCIRLYPENIIDLFNQTPEGTAVTVVDQPIKLAWLEDKLYLEVHPDKNQANEIESKGTIALPDNQIPEDFKNWILKNAGDNAHLIDWDIVNEAFVARKSYPIVIAKKNISIQND